MSKTIDPKKPPLEKRLLNQQFPYYTAASTDVSRHFEEVFKANAARREQRAQQKERA